MKLSVVNFNNTKSYSPKTTMTMAFSGDQVKFVNANSKISSTNNSLFNTKNIILAFSVITSFLSIYCIVNNFKKINSLEKRINSFEFNLKNNLEEKFVTLENLVKNKLPVLPKAKETLSDDKLLILIKERVDKNNFFLNRIIDYLRPIKLEGKNVENLMK